MIFMSPAQRLMPDIREIIEMLNATGSLLSRMSGSGATCFALYANRAMARLAAATIYAGPVQIGGSPRATFLSVMIRDGLLPEPWYNQHSLPK
jgi:4-diphosphocytidyl-2C-methyl-D-erythritol kinase